MKFLRYFTESTLLGRSDFYHAVDKNEFLKKLGVLDPQIPHQEFGRMEPDDALSNIIDFDYIEFSELSEFFQSKFPDMDYSRGSKILTLEQKPSIGYYTDGNGIPLNKLPNYSNKKLASSFLSNTFSAWHDEDIKKLKLSDDNSFAFSFTKGTLKINSGSRNTISDLDRSLCIVLKVSDEYFLVCDVGVKNFPHVDCKYFVCDDIEGLTTFLDDHLSQSLKEYRYDNVYQLYLKEN